METEERVLTWDYPSEETSKCPYPFYAQLREHDPVHRLETGEFLVSRWEDLDHVVRHPEIFASGVGHLRADYREAMAGAEAGDDAMFTPWPLPYSDPPEHRLKRTLCQPLFTRERMRDTEPLVRELVDELIDEFRDRGTCEFVTGFANRLPQRVMLTLFGLSRDEEERFAWMGTATEGPGIKFVSEEQKQRIVERSRTTVEFFRNEILDRREHPRDDFLSELVQMHVERDGALDIRYLTAEATNLFGAGNLTTGHMLSATLLALLEQPEELRRAAEDPARIRYLIEESLRLESPVQWVQRLVKRDTELGGVPIPEGSIVFILFGSADRDGERFPDEETFDPGRGNLIKDHVAFGRGPHRCVGAPLARLEGQVAFEALLALPNLRLAGGDAVVHAPSPSGHFRGLDALRIAFDVPAAG